MRNRIAILLLAFLVSGATCRPKPDKHINVPPAPTTAKIEKAVDSAATGTKDARKDVQTAKSGATDSGVKSIIAPLESADTKLGEVIETLTTAHQEIQDYNIADKQHDTAQDAVYSQAVKDVAKLKKENQKLKDEYSRKIRRILGSISAGLIALGILACMTKIIPALALFPGLRVGVPLLVTGFVMGFVAIYFAQIIFWTGIALGVCILGVILYAIFHTINFTPKQKVTAKDLLHFDTGFFKRKKESTT